MRRCRSRTRLRVKSRRPHLRRLGSRSSWWAVAESASSAMPTLRCAAPRVGGIFGAMDVDLAALPDDIGSLHRLIRDFAADRAGEGTALAKAVRRRHADAGARSGTGLDRERQAVGAQDDWPWTGSDPPAAVYFYIAVPNGRSRILSASEAPCRSTAIPASKSWSPRAGAAACTAMLPSRDRELRFPPYEDRPAVAHRSLATLQLRRVRSERAARPIK